MATEFTHSTLESRFTGMISVCCCIVERKRETKTIGGSSCSERMTFCIRTEMSLRAMPCTVPRFAGYTAKQSLGKGESNAKWTAGENL